MMGVYRTDQNLTDIKATPDIQRVILGGSGRQAQGNASMGLLGFGLLPGHNMPLEVENTNANTDGFLMTYWGD